MKEPQFETLHLLERHLEGKNDELGKANEIPKPVCALWQGGRYILRRVMLLAGPLAVRTIDMHSFSRYDFKLFCTIAEYTL